MTQIVESDIPESRSPYYSSEIVSASARVERLPLIAGEYEVIQTEYLTSLQIHDLTLSLILPQEQSQFRSHTHSTAGTSSLRLFEDADPASLIEHLGD
jgi:hypothetical protein